MVDFAFNASEHEPTGDYDILPVGWYQAVIVESDIRPTKTGTGQRLNFQFQIVKPDSYANRRVFLGLNIKNDNAMAQEIAQKDLSKLCHACNKLNMSNTEDLHGIPLNIKLRVDQGNDQYEARNEVRDFKKIDDVVQLVGGGSEQTPPGWATKKADTKEPAAKAAQQEVPREDVPPVSEVPPWERN